MMPVESVEWAEDQIRRNSTRAPTSPSPILASAPVAALAPAAALATPTLEPAQTLEPTRAGAAGVTSGATTATLALEAGRINGGRGR